MNRFFLASLVLTAALVGGGCVENAPQKADSAGQQGRLAKPHAECLVCKYENDLACVDIDVDKDTPHTTVDGKEYFFCSKECQKDFQKDPKKYVKQK